MWNDSDIGVEWPIDGIEVKLSDKDRKKSTLEEIEEGGFKFVFKVR